MKSHIHLLIQKCITFISHEYTEHGCYNVQSMYNVQEIDVKLTLDGKKTVISHSMHIPCRNTDYHHTVIYYKRKHKLMITEGCA